MDRDAELKNLEDKRDFIQNWLDNDITKEMLADAKEEETGMLNLLLSRTPHNLETLLSHFEMIGELRRVRMFRGAVQAKLEEVNDEIKAL